MNRTSFSADGSGPQVDTNADDDLGGVRNQFQMTKNTLRSIGIDPLNISESPTSRGLPKPVQLESSQIQMLQASMIELEKHVYSTILSLQQAHHQANMPRKMPFMNPDSPELDMQRAGGSLSPGPTGVVTKEFHSEDAEVGRWLNETFTNTKKKPKKAEDRPEERNVGFLGRGSANNSVTQTPMGTDRVSPKGSYAPGMFPPGGRLTPVGSASNLASNDGGEKRLSVVTEDDDRPEEKTPDESPRSLSGTTPSSRYSRKSLGSRARTSRVDRVMTTLSAHNIPFLDVDNIDFDIFSVLERFEGNMRDTFLYVCANVLFRYALIQDMELNVPKLIEFLLAIQSAYRDENPYHNSLHAADVLQTTHIYLVTNDVRDNFSNEEVLVVLFSAIVHDVGHLGIGNSFLIKTQHPLAALYNDSSPLESMHATLAFHVLQRFNFFAGAKDWDEDRAVHFREQVLQVVVGTDMKFHQSTTTSVVDILADGMVEDDEINILLKAIVHAADLSNPMKPLPIYKNWSDRVVAEFWQQGDEERRRDLQISMMCDRNDVRIPASQVGFINFIVKPFMAEFSMLLPEKWMERLENNLRYMHDAKNDSYDISQIQKLAAVKWRDNWHLSPLAKAFQETLELAQAKRSTAATPPRSPNVKSPAAEMFPGEGGLLSPGARPDKLLFENSKQKISALGELCVGLTGPSVYSQRLLELVVRELRRQLADPHPSKLDVLEGNQHFAQNIFRLVDAELRLTDPHGRFNNGIAPTKIVELIFGEKDASFEERKRMLDDKRWCATAMKERIVDVFLGAEFAGRGISAIAGNATAGGSADEQFTAAPFAPESDGSLTDAVRRVVDDFVANVENIWSRKGSVADATAMNVSNQSDNLQAQESFSTEDQRMDRGEAMMALLEAIDVHAVSCLKAAATTWAIVVRYVTDTRQKDTIQSTGRSLVQKHHMALQIHSSGRSSALSGVAGAEHIAKSAYANTLAPLVMSPATSPTPGMARSPERSTIGSSLGPTRGLTLDHQALLEQNKISRSGSPALSPGSEKLKVNRHLSIELGESPNNNQFRTGVSQQLMAMQQQSPGKHQKSPARRRGSQSSSRRGSLGSDSNWALPSIVPDDDLPIISVPQNSIATVSVTTYDQNSLTTTVTQERWIGGSSNAKDAIGSGSSGGASSLSPGSGGLNLGDTIGNASLTSPIANLLPTPSSTRRLNGSDRSPKINKSLTVTDPVLESTARSAISVGVPPAARTPLPEVLQPLLPPLDASRSQMMTRSATAEPHYNHELALGNTNRQSGTQSGSGSAQSNHLVAPSRGDALSSLSSTMNSATPRDPAIPDIFRRNTSMSKESSPASGSMQHRPGESGGGGPQSPNSGSISMRSPESTHAAPA